MKVKNNYNECLTNLACSIRKYFELDYKHNTIEYIDEILNENKPKNVVTILCDGMGSNIMDRILSKDSFLLKHRIKSITTVFPATTVAATTSIMTGLNPVETAMLGWDMYYKEIDKTITTFLNCEKGDPDHKEIKEAILYKEKHMITTPIIDEINKFNKGAGYSLFPFGDNCYTDIDDMFTKIEKICLEKGKKYIYAYIKEPDHTLHENGCECEIVKEIMESINDKIENLSKVIKDAIIFVVADHGHKSVKNIDLNDYPDIVQCLDKNTSLEQRAVNFFVKKSKKAIFPELFNKHFKDDFDLYDKQDIIISKLFGDGEENAIFRDILGDYLAIAKTDKAIVYGGSKVLKSQHAGYTDDEVLVPLIVINVD